VARALTFLLFMWISECFLFTEVVWPFLSRFFRMFANQHFFFTCADALYVHIYYVVVMKECRVVWWLCGVGSSLCGFLIYLTFRYAIIVYIIVDLCCNELPGEEGWGWSST
jgi:hypothetical protein